MTAASEIIIRKTTIRLELPDVFNNPVDPLVFGLIRDVKFKLTPIPAGRDSHGRTQVAGFDCQVDFFMMQTHPDTIGRIAAYQDDPVAGQLILDSGTTSIGLFDVMPRFEFDIDGAGGASSIKVMADLFLEKDQLLDIITAGTTYQA